MISIRRRISIGLLVLVTLIGLTWAAEGTKAASALGKPELKRALLGTVRVVVPIDAEKDTYSTGSGTILTPDGYILTNYHVMGDKATKKLYNKQGAAVIGVNPTDLQGLPTFPYLAVMVKGDPTLDLAVLKITAPAKGGDLPQSLGLMIVPIADSDKVEIGDPVSVIGFPGIGGNSVTFTGGTVAGFLDEDNDKVNDWLKTDAEINHGNSGGLAINDAGEMVGVPTAGVADTSMSGKIGLLRPVNRALAMLKAAIVSGPTTSPSQPSKNGAAQIGNVVFSDSVDANDKPGKTGSNFPSGTKSLYAFFDYNVFTDGLRLEWYWTANGEARDVQQQNWQGGATGNWWLSLSNKNGLADGAYDINISFDSVLLAKARVTIGAVAPTQVKGTLGTPTFAEGISANQPAKPHASGEPFAAGSTALYAFFTYKDMQDGTPWSEVWSIDGQEVLRNARQWQFGASGSAWVNVSNKGGLPNGRYKVQLYLAETLASEAEATIGAASAKPIAAGDGVQVIGIIKDRDTGNPIPGAAFIVVKPGVDVQAFAANPTDDAVVGLGICDNKGIFVLNATLQRGQVYGAAVAAQGYQPTLGKITVAQDDVSPLQFELFLQKR